MDLPKKSMGSHRRHIPRASGAAGVGQDNPEHLKILETWMRSYKAEELFDENGKFIDELAALSPWAIDEWAVILMSMADVN